MSSTYDLSMLSMQYRLSMLDQDDATLHRAALTTCDHALDVEDARMLLAMLGLIDAPIELDAP